ncbi:MAG: inositol-3-phosphate synthase, partial [Candidatus Pacebacteria bacterium]|nr:inositol-3-phosphate synthase [Candidatus Paceibacterota bacterium]
MENKSNDREIRIAISGIGNCCSALVQGIHYYKDVNSDDELVPGLMHNVLGGYKISDIKIVAAFDIDKRKVGKDISEAIFEKPNCTKVFCGNLPKTGVIVQMGPILDGVADHMKDYPEEQTFLPSDEEPVDVVEELKKNKVDVLVNYMPVGSQKATEFYADA